MREVVEIQPTPVRRKSREDDPYKDLRYALAGLGELREPEKAEEPILAPQARAALFGWLSEINAADSLEEIGLKPRSTAVLHGPPGCGKTTLAHHLAARLGIPMVVVGPETILGSHLGESEKNVKRLFDALGAFDNPCVLFMDEIEAVGRRRDQQGSGECANATMSTLTVLLRKIEEYRGFMVAATNRPQDLDPALWRRFHIQLPIDLPGGDERFAILKRYGMPFQFNDDDLDRLTDLTEGASPALLRGLMEGAKRALIINPRIGRSIDDPVAVFASVLSSIQPPPELEKPALWASAQGVRTLSDMAWPPSRADVV